MCLSASFLRWEKWKIGETSRQQENSAVYVIVTCSLQPVLGQEGNLGKSSDSGGRNLTFGITI